MLTPPPTAVPQEGLAIVDHLQQRLRVKSSILAQRIIPDLPKTRSAITDMGCSSQACQHGSVFGHRHPANRGSDRQAKILNWDCMCLYLTKCKSRYSDSDMPITWASVELIYGSTVVPLCASGWCPGSGGGVMAFLKLTNQNHKLSKTC